MFLQGVLHISLYFLAASITTALLSSPDFDDSYLPRLRLSREEVQGMKEAQLYPPGYIHRYITLQGDSDAVSVPVVEADPNILLDDEDGVRARSLAPRDQCSTYNARRGVCFIIYCWQASNGTLFTAYLILKPDPTNPKQGNPSGLSTSNINCLSLNTEYNTGYKHWFPNGHECSNHDTIIYTNHYLADGTKGVAWIHGLECDNCDFAGIGCMANTGFNGNNNNMGAWSSNSAALYYC